MLKIEQIKSKHGCQHMITKIKQFVPKVRFETVIITCSKLSLLLFSVNFNNQNTLANNDEIQTRKEKKITKLKILCKIAIQ